MVCVAHLAGRRDYNPRERLYDPHCRDEAIYQFPITIAIFLEDFLSLVE